MHQAFGRLALSLPSAFSSSFDGNCSRSSRAIFESWSAAFFLLPLKVFCAHSDSSLATTEPCALVVVRVYFTSSGIVICEDEELATVCTVRACLEGAGTATSRSRSVVGQGWRSGGVCTLVRASLGILHKELGRHHTHAHTRACPPVCMCVCERERVFAFFCFASASRELVRGLRDDLRKV